MDILVSILVALLLIILNGYFSMSEMALISARRSVLQQIIDSDQVEQSARASRALQMAADSDRLLATIQVAITLLSLGSSIVAATALAIPIANWLNGFGLAWLSAIAGPLSVITITLVISYISLVIGELVPKRIALANAEKTAMRTAGVINFCARLTRPVVTFLSASTNLIARIFGIKSADDRQAVSEEEIKYLVTEQETLLDEEKRMIREIFDLGDTVAREIMTPRVDMISLEDDATVGAAINRMRGTGFSRLPVYHENPDRIIGIVMLKDLLAPMIDDRADDPVTDFLRELMFIPETKDILPLLGEMQTSHQQVAIVVDEYGGTAGIISVEDIVEEIVGEIADEYDPDNKYQTQLSENEWLIDGRFPTDDARELGFPVQEGDDYETIAGWLLDTIDSVPQVGDVFEIEGYTFKVQSMRRRRISLLRVTNNRPTEDDSEQFQDSD
ncbi:MAG: hemolysin family protein [Coriobacteriales bacterium]|jgi:putative hemolysin|nr:hemolysin family protein [Coriobacteriales bacterium]